jgi:tRNA U34 5-methylaminomethyl-2-thiouridine-forming methyltransferase MnmC
MTTPFKSAPEDQRRPDTLSWREGDMPYSEEFGDFYYSRADGRAESRHVFVDGNRLAERFATASRFTVAELGFGTGLNFLETWDTWDRTAPEASELTFHSFELKLLEAPEIKRAISVWPELEDRVDRMLEGWPEHADDDVSLVFSAGTKTIRLFVHRGFAHDVLPQVDIKADAWFLDGFAPSRNPEMWSADLLKAVAAKTASGGTLATYSAAGWVRRNLQAAGFIVEKCPGHAGKRDMTIGRLEA